MDLSNITVNEQSSIRSSGEKIIYFDPFEIKEETHDADIIFVTHEHFDHFQPESIAKIKKDNTIIVAPATMEKNIKDANVSNVRLLEPNQTYEIDGLGVKTIPAYNKLKPFHMKSKKWLGYVVCMDNINYYIAGDTDVNEDILKVECDVALIPVGGKFTMDKKQAADYILNINPKAAIPTHYGNVVGNPKDGNEFMALIEKSGCDIQVELKL